MPSLWLAAIAVPWLAALVLACLPRAWDRAAGAIALGFAVLTAGGVTAGLVAAPATGALATLASGPAALGLGPGAEPLWIRDGLSALFALLTAWIAALVTLFATAYMPHAQAEAGSSRRDASFYALLSAFTGAMLALVSAGNLVQLYLCWELTGLLSYLLIGYWHHRAEARAGAPRALALTTAGGVALLVGLATLGVAAGTWSLPELLADPAAWREAPALEAIAALVAVGALAKSAQLPFSSWLPGAMAAPTPVSAFLHSSALVAAGVYLVARFFPLLGHALAWQAILVAAGIAGTLVAGFLALKQDQLKAMLAYSTVSQYGVILLAFGTGGVAGAEAGIYAFFVHAIIKAGLFLVVGAVAHVSGQTRYDEVGGLAASNPVLTAAAFVLALSLGGVPIMGGFYYKEELLHVAYDQRAWGLLAALLAGGMLTLLYMLRFLVEVFLDPRLPAQRPGRMPVAMGAPILALAGVALAAGVFPAALNATVLEPAMAAVVLAPVRFAVALEPGAVLLLSLAVVATGAALGAAFRRSERVRAALRVLPEGPSLGGARLLAAYTAASHALLALHDGNLRRYVRVVLAGVLALVAACWAGLPWEGARVRDPIDLPQAALLAASVLAAVATIGVRVHAVAAVTLTISGFALAAAFALMHAPDVALAQVLVETLATLSIVAALWQTGLVHPQGLTILAAGRPEPARTAIALAVGGVVGWATFWAARAYPPDPVGGWYAREGFHATGMADLVTAILTDFRGLDTAIEILVFVAAAMAIVALFARRPDHPERVP